MAKEPVAKLLEIILNSLDIPESYYQRAADRHRSLGEWLCRPESKVAVFEPHITPQGSFRYTSFRSVQLLSGHARPMSGSLCMTFRSSKLAALFR
jgi:hypothetical protein